MGISAKVEDRISSQLKKFQPILADAHARDVSESDTVVIIGDMLADVLGYKKYSEITTEHSIRGTYVDLAVKVGNDVRFLVEAKAIGSTLKDNHVKQAIDYGANNGIEWVLLTNGVVWQVYKVHFKQPIDKSLIFEFDMLQCNPKNLQVVECLGNLSREGFEQSSMTSFYQQRQITSKFSIAALLLSEPMLDKLRREIRRLSPGCRIEADELDAVLRNEVLKRDVFDGDEAKQSAEFIKKAARALERAKAKAAAEEKPNTAVAATKEEPATDTGQKAA
jgi:predicted type IV restriction endonuclease